MFAHFVLQTLGLVGVAAFLTIRVWAIWGKALMPALFVLLITGLVPAANIYEFARPKIIAFIDEQCSLTLVSPPGHAFGAIVRGMAMAGDLVVLLLTYIKTVGIWRAAPAASKFTGTRPRLSTLLIRDGTVYFVSMLIMNLVNLILLLRAQPADASTSFKFIQIMNVINANLIARFVLDLRVTASSDGGGSSESLGCPTVGSVSTIQFRAQSVGFGEVMAGSVGEGTSTWVSGQDDVDAGDT
ncbi:hypothetical protein EIP91_003871 [Steccherinum ochraceum]|uniref:Uncharacterized protein n=1 Tax=Steccherinum ochraceum TaxID=92696 RepID=A0A4R0RCA6_9APHY|nr:hypothetical protein EIP91_003871 [Steccherinum ochraceum]